MTTTEKLQNASAVIVVLLVFVLCAIIAMKSDEINKLNLSKTELQSKLNIKNAEIEVAKRDLEEAHEMAGLLFLESMAVTDSYNELKKQCKKVKR
jgi:Mg2+/Co2+ transporter CorB